MIGIDNGSTGSICWINPVNGKVDFFYPVTTQEKSMYYDGYMSVITIKNWIKLLSHVGKHPEETVFCEKPMINPRRFKGSISAIVNHENLISACTLLGIRFIVIDSREWQKMFFKDVKPKTVKQVAGDSLMALFIEGKIKVNNMTERVMRSFIEEYSADAYWIARYGQEVTAGFCDWYKEVLSKTIEANSGIFSKLISEFGRNRTKYASDVVTSVNNDALSRITDRSNLIEWGEAVRNPQEIFHAENKAVHPINMYGEQKTIRYSATDIGGLIMFRAKPSKPVVREETIVSVDDPVPSMHVQYNAQCEPVQITTPYEQVTLTTVLPPDAPVVSTPVNYGYPVRWTSWQRLY